MDKPWWKDPIFSGLTINAYLDPESAEREAVFLIKFRNRADQIIQCKFKDLPLNLRQLDTTDIDGLYEV